MKIVRKNWPCALGILCGGLIVATTAPSVLAQTTPSLIIAPAATNSVSITISNAIPAAVYAIWWTPNLGDTTDYPWTLAAPGGVGQTNFILPNWEFPAVFFRGLLETNGIPLWEAADPNNSTNGILTITIASPANGAVLQ